MNRDASGVNIHMAQGEMLDLVPRLNAGCVRVDANWYDFEPERGRYDFQALDATIHGCRQRNLEVLVTIKGTPAWANGGAGQNRPPINPQDWTDAVRMIAEHYRHNVWQWEIWNEPNRENFWEVGVGSYVYDLFLPASRVLRSVGAENRTVGPVITLMSGWEDWLSTFIERARPALELLSVHAYEDDGREVCRKLGLSKYPWPQSIWKTRLIDVLRATGTTNIPVWLTETGWQAPDGDGERRQAESLDQLMETIPSGPWLQRFFYYQLIDEPGESRGLYRQDGSPKPASAVFARRASA